MTGILLAGGKSKRMGNSKAFIRFKGKLLYEYPLEVLKKHCTEILISSSDKRFRSTGYPVVTDIIQSAGPLGGIYTCLRKIKTEKALILSCDTPFVSSSFAELIINNSRDTAVTVGINQNGQIEPLAGVYDKNVLSFLEEMIDENDYKVNHLFDRLRVKYIDPSLEGMDPEKLFFNVNYPADLEEAKKIEELIDKRR
jgi:molybdopterin-guanine dinucleotide biosynthesis protein A